MPKSILEMHDGWSWRLAWSYLPKGATWRLSHADGRVRYLKVGTVGPDVRVSEECARMRWAAAHLPVPEVIDCGRSGEVEWLLTAALPGSPATDEWLKADPESLVAALARGLHRFHSAPVEACPFDFRIDAALELARSRVFDGLVNPEEDFHPEHSHLSPESAIEELERLRPDAEDQVVCHGDYCPPNVLIDGGEAVGFLDLGELDVSDRWRDLAVATWSVTWNFGPGWEVHFMATYGVDSDPLRIAFYRLLYDLVS